MDFIQEWRGLEDPHADILVSVFLRTKNGLRIVQVHPTEIGQAN
jgi:hypothetical protein